MNGVPFEQSKKENNNKTTAKMKHPLTLILSLLLMSFSSPTSLEENQSLDELTPPGTYYAYFVATSRDNQKRLITSPISYTVTDQDCNTQDEPIKDQLIAALEASDLYEEYIEGDDFLFYACYRNHGQAQSARQKIRNKYKKDYEVVEFTFSYSE